MGGATRLSTAKNLSGSRELIPDDVSVVGFGDIEFGEFMQPALTTVRLSRKDVADKAFSTLAKLIPGNSEKGSESDFETHLVARDSTGPRSPERVLTERLLAKLPVDNRSSLR